MIIGISKERLIELNDLTPTGTEYLMGKKAMLEELISHECKELNPWLPIDENTPKDRRILLLYPAMLDTPSVTGLWNALKGRFVADIVIHGSIRPTHWQELPENPNKG